MSDGDLGDWEDAIGGEPTDDEMLSLDWDTMSAGSPIPGYETPPMLDQHPEPEDLMVTQYGQTPWGPGGGEGYQPWAQLLTDSPPMGDAEEDLLDEQPQYAAEYAHPGIDPETLYDRDSFEAGMMDRQTYGSGIFDGPEQGPVFRPDDGIFAHDYALPGYIAREPTMDVFETEALDVNTGLPTVAQVSAGGVQLMRSQPERAWSPFAPPTSFGTPQNAQPYSQQPLYSYEDSAPIEAFGFEGARALLELAATQCPYDQNQRGWYICQMIDALVPALSNKALAALAKLQSAGYQGNAVEPIVAHVLMYVAVCDVADAIKGKHPGLRRLDQLQRIGAATPAIVQAAGKHLGPLVADPARGTRAVRAFRASKTGAVNKGMLGDDELPNDATAPAPNGAATAATANGGWAKYLLGVAALGLAGWAGYEYWWKPRQAQANKPRRARKRRARAA